MPEPFFRLRPGLDRKPIQFVHDVSPEAGDFLRAGVAGAYLPPLRLSVPHRAMERTSFGVPQCLAMVLEYYGRSVDPEFLAGLLRTDETYGTHARNLEWLRAWGVQTELPEDLQFFRDGTCELHRRLGVKNGRLVYRWEERWLRYVRAALRKGVPPILFVDLGRVSRQWRGLMHRHAVVLVGGEGRYAWINDPAHETGPTRIGLSTLMDALFPGEPLAALVTCTPSAKEAIGEGTEVDRDEPPAEDPFDLWGGAR